MHARNLNHKDVKPSNVLANPATGEVWLMGFGIASRLPRERQPPEPPEFIAGTLPYMAPEQTGRMNRSIDSRSDLYSLGVTLYEMLTGSLPFTASDPMEWVHCHIARQPVPPGERVTNVPGPVSAIIMKLLAKTAEERYQTAAGLESDLRRCLDEWESRCRIDEFRLGERDIPDRLLIPEKLYGRASEIETLLAAFDRIVAGGRPELVLISGYSGIGKSSVVNELHKMLVPPRGLFAAGKFDQYKRDIPYATLAQAFQSLLRQLLTKSEPDLSKWRDAFRQALDPNAQLIVDLVAELKLIIGEQPPVPELPPQDAQRRFQLVFQRFINVFARPEHPLALFLDDLQWLDTAMLDLLEDLLTQSDVRHLLLIGAYRDNEVNSTHPLIRKLQAIRQAEAKVREIALAPLAVEDLERLLADSVHCELERAAPLARIIHEKTAGNPFFAIHFISALAEESLLTFDHDERRWSWDLNRIRAKGYTDNVVDLLIGKLNRLPVETQRALQLLACMGNSAEFALLEMASEHSNEEVHDRFWEAVRAGLIFRTENSYRFLHDRVQEAAYSLIPEESRAEAHLRIGRLLAAHTPPESREERIFEIVNQLNRGAALITARDEREQLAELNLIAGRRAKASTAYSSALKYLIDGEALLSADAWEHRHQLIFSLELERAECEFLTGQSTAAEERLIILSSRAANTVQLAAVTCLQVDLYTTLDQMHRAVDVCLDYLRQLGTNWSPHPATEEVQREYVQIWSRLAGRHIEELIELPLMSDAVSLATLDVLTKVLPPALFTDANLLSLAICRAVNLSLERGNSDGSCVAYGWLGQIAGPHFNDYKAGFRFGQLGYELVEKRGFMRFQARTYMVFGSHVMPWAKHVRAARDLIRRAFEVASRNGDLSFAAFSGVNLNANLLAAGDPLAEVQREAERGLEFAQKTRFGYAIDVITVQLGFIRTLNGSTPEFGCFDDGQFEELRFERRLADDPPVAQLECFYWIRKLQARFFARDYASAVDASLRAERLLWSVPSNFESVDYRYYGALSLAASWGSASFSQKQQAFDALATHHRQLEVWAGNCPENFENRAALVGAEIARIEGRVLDAERLYELAIHSANANGFVHNEAVAYELAAGFYAARGFDRIADAYLWQARYSYLRWGADGKVRQLDHLYPHLKREEATPGPTSTIVTPVELLDLATIIKVSQAVSGELVLGKLIERLMRTAIEQAGAGRALLILSQRDELRIEAEATTAGDTVSVLLRQADIRADAMPVSILHYVVRTQESVILEDASGLNPFSADPYIVQHRARSVLCLPLINQAKFTGVLYLENNLTPQVFTPGRITVLKVVASQAAISLENTRLYRDLEDREAKIRRLVDANILGIFLWNLEGAIVGANEAFLRMVQYEREDVIFGRVRWTDLTPAEDRARDERAVAELKTTGTVQPYEKEFFRKDGSRLPVLVGAANFEGSKNDGVAFVLDLSEQKRSEAEIRGLKDQLYRENLALRDAYREISELKEKLVQEKLYLEEEIRGGMDFDQIVGNSLALKQVLRLVETVAPSDSTVLLLGETGTGKELVARAVHDRSRRKGRTFVKVNCAAIPTGLLESELFGHEKGAFTGAISQKIGRLELADRGTLFLDEVGDIPPDIQPKLLRALQEQEFERLGSTRTLKVNVRLIAATNRNLEKMVAAREFRSDLYYRLNVFPIRIPPLRERKEDIPLLVGYFVQKFAKQTQKNIERIPKAVMNALTAWQWPGNIRELENFVERSVILTRGKSLEAPLAELRKLNIDEYKRDQPQGKQEDIARIVEETIKALGGKNLVTDGRAKKQREEIVRALTESRGRVGGPNGAATRMGINRTTLLARMRKFGIDPKQYD